jgi:D-alanine-D-alanine ligase
MNIGIAYDLKSDFALLPGAPDDALEEYDAPATIDAIARVLAARGHKVSKLGGGRRFLAAMLETPPDLVFNIAEGRGSRSREAHVPAVCEMLGVPCTHSDPLTMAVALDKGIAKRVVASHGVATPSYAVLERAADLDGLALAFPLFAKPLGEGSSMGIRGNTKLLDIDALRARVADLLVHYRQPVLVEEYCSGPEFTVAVLGAGATARVAGVMEIVPKRAAVADFVYSLEMKRSANWRELMDYVVPPPRAARDVDAVAAVALAAYRALGCRDIARVDLRMRGDGAPMFIEANPLPGIAPGWSDLALLWDRLGQTYDDLVGAILDEACRRLELA